MNPLSDQRQGIILRMAKGFQNFSRHEIAELYEEARQVALRERRRELGDLFDEQIRTLHGFREASVNHLLQQKEGVIETALDLSWPSAEYGRVVFVPVVTAQGEYFKRIARRVRWGKMICRVEIDFEHEREEVSIPSTWGSYYIFGVDDGSKGSKKTAANAARSIHRQSRSCLTTLEVLALALHLQEGQWKKDFYVMGSRYCPPDSAGEKGRSIVPVLRFGDGRYVGEPPVLRWARSTNATTPSRVTCAPSCAFRKYFL